jgi:ribosomal-protein-alanine N-acetyltransferase
VITPLTTPRLLLRAVTSNDASFVLELMNEHPYIENIGDRGIRTVADAERYLHEKYVPAYEHYGYGMYVVDSAAERVPVGICGLVRRDILDQPDLGFAFLQRHWSRGYALEAAAAIITHARDQLRLPIVYGVVSPHNARSIRLLEKLRFRYARAIQLPGQSAVSHLYAVTPSEPSRR